jgi:hypothetical protein
MTKDPHVVPLALSVLWLIVTTFCWRRAAAALIGSAAPTVVLCWLFWQQAQGWSGDADQRLATFGEFALAVALGLVLGTFIPRLFAGRRRAREEQAVLYEAAFTDTLINHPVPPRRSAVTAPREVFAVEPARPGFAEAA